MNTKKTQLGGRMVYVCSGDLITKYVPQISAI